MTAFETAFEVGFDASEPITSQTGAARARKARETLVIAGNILSDSGKGDAAFSCREIIRRINRQLTAFYEAENQERQA